MADLNQHEDEREHGHRHGSTYRVAGALTITRAATTQREIDALPDPVTIDLSEVNRMDHLPHRPRPQCEGDRCQP